MAGKNPTGEIDARYSSEGAAPVQWAHARGLLESAEVFWLSTVRPDGRPHVTPLLAVWLADALYFCTGAEERKAQNLARNPHCILTTGHNTLASGLDLVVEGDAVRTKDHDLLKRLAGLYVAKYGTAWSFEVRDGAFHHPGGGEALVYGVSPTKVLGFGKGTESSQTRWRF
ncbi:pyridoxamine 5'-phosphate oxidase family protein [Nocardiopsis ansamitocini]|uniref:Pyridoxamine 5'-phosphate oxidase n=1 Tax=Nocardiopsis ansamitocini TaxID=1670832 RepID=A0A9W6P242_9ACTN|nr:pyridoxamine 5'-phosphate oxidase family protein [Nocardiopsis ansamitocini]GLU45731.1 pyridoxamine 5'-phosphate oxidase [Nocardiopsis ansamitocini]